MEIPIEFDDDGVPVVDCLPHTKSMYEGGKVPMDCDELLVGCVIRTCDALQMMLHSRRSNTYRMNLTSSASLPLFVSVLVILLLRKYFAQV